MVFRAASPLAGADIEGALELVVESGWNQVAADWQLFIDLGQALKLPADDDDTGAPIGSTGAIAATAAILPYDRFGWISMVLVRGTHRRRGIATALLDECVEQLRARGLVPVLDATPAGREVYRRIGFVDGWSITRWRRHGGAQDHGGQANESGAVQVRRMRGSDLDAVVALDARAFGADRAGLLRRLVARCSGFACVAQEEGRITGFLLGRDGRVATQVGPIVADDEATAQALLAQAAQRIEGQVIVDAVDRHKAFAHLLKASGFAMERPYTRMAQGAKADFGDAGSTFAIAGPELG